MCIYIAIYIYTRSRRILSPLLSTCRRDVLSPAYLRFARHPGEVRHRGSVLRVRLRLLRRLQEDLPRSGGLPAEGELERTDRNGRTRRQFGPAAVTRYTSVCVCFLNFSIFLDQTNNLDQLRRQ